jgi:SNF2 family DNA or RNA helicase
LQLIREGLEAKEPVVVFNTMKDSTHLIERELRRAGIECRCVDGDVKPADRARIMLEFKAGKFPVLLAGLEAVSLGHNLENARRAIVFSLPFDLAGFDQAINRIHRLTSKQNVSVHVLLTRGSIDERMWDLVQRKGAAAGLALDGALGYDDIEEVNWNEFAKQLREEFRREEAVPAAIVSQQIKDVWHGLSLLTDKSGRQIGAAAGLLDSVSFDLSAAL